MPAGKKIAMQKMVHIKNPDIFALYLLYLEIDLKSLSFNKIILQNDFTIIQDSVIHTCYVITPKKWTTK